MNRAVLSSGATVQVVGAVRGLYAEAGAVARALDEFRPTALGLGISSEELRSFSDHFLGTEQEPVIPLTSTELAEIRGLARFGEVRVPNPALIAAMEWGRAHDVRTEALDPSDDRYATMFADTISYVELVRRTVRERKLTRRPPTAATPDDYALAWDQFTAGGRDSRRFAYQRDGVVVEGILQLAERAPRVSVVVDRERFSRVVEMLGQNPIPAPRPLPSSLPRGAPSGGSAPPN